jgi:hypothetical protein
MKVKIDVDEQSGASILLLNGKNEAIGLDARDDQLSIELGDEIGFPRLELSSSGDIGIVVRLRIFEPGRGEFDSPHVCFGIDPEGRPWVNLSGDPAGA